MTVTSRRRVGKIYSLAPVARLVVARPQASPGRVLDAPLGMGFALSTTRLLTF